MAEPPSGIDVLVYARQNYPDTRVIVMLADPFSTPMDQVLDAFNAFYAGIPGDSSMWRQRVTSLTPTFSPGETILVRFRLFADLLVNAWGWAIDDLQIQHGSVTAASDPPSVRALTLQQNAPNPFNAVTTIRWTLPRDTDATLRIYDVRGRLVRALVDGHQTAGAYSVTWDGRSDRGATVASGAYFYRLRAGDELRQRRMTIVK